MPNRRIDDLVPTEPDCGEEFFTKFSRQALVDEMGFTFEADPDVCGVDEDLALAD